MKNAIITSPCFSCGMGHILEMMLLLDVRVDSFGPMHAHHWEQKEDGWKLSEKGYSHYKLHSKFIKNGKIYKFKDESSVLIEHMPNMFHEARHYGKVILLVRDPVDAIYSWYRRKQYEDELLISFEQYLASITYFHHHSRFSLFQGTPMSVFAMYCAFWLGSSKNVSVVRYEDLKSSATAWRDFLLSINIHPSENEIVDAFKASNQHVGDDDFRKVNHKGLLFEYKNRISDEQHDEILSKGIMAPIARALGYVANTIDVKSMFLEIGSPIDKVCMAGISELKNRIDDKDNPSDLDNLISWYEDFLSRNIKRGLRGIGGQASVFLREDVHYLICQKAVVRFIRELYLGRTSCEGDDIYLIFSSLLRFLYWHTSGVESVFMQEKFFHNGAASSKSFLP